MGGQGYGLMLIGRDIRVIASRFAWEVLQGHKMPRALEAAHHCNNPPCCNPWHIYAATRQQNVDDIVRAGRTTRGSRQANSKLTEADIPYIDTLYREGVPVRTIADVFHASTGAIYGAVLRHNWRHIPVAPEESLV